MMVNIYECDGERYADLINIRNREILLGNVRSLSSFEETITGLNDTLHAKVTEVVRSVGFIDGVYGEFYFGTHPTLYLPKQRSVFQDASYDHVICGEESISFTDHGRTRNGSSFVPQANDWKVHLVCDSYNGCSNPFRDFVDSCLDTSQMARDHLARNYEALFTRFRSFVWEDKDVYKKTCFENRLIALENGIAYLSICAAAAIK